MTRPEDLPDFERPPIDEVAIALQYAAIDGYTDELSREFWRTVRQDYPFVENQLPLDIEIETREPKPKLTQYVISTTPPKSMRLWMISDSDDYLIQIQNNRFIQNWRRRGAEYPHFEDVRDLLWVNYQKYKKFLNKAGLPQPKLQQTEVTYVNWVDDLAPADFLRPTSQASISVAGTSYQSEAQAWSARYLVPSEDPEIVQRLYVQASMAVRAKDPTSVGTQLSLVVRAANEDGIEEPAAVNLIRDARRIIVEAFTSLTTHEAHQRWGRFS